MFRTKTCGELRLADAGSTVTLAGWVQRSRKMGGMTFVDLRDRYGLTQIVFITENDPALHEAASHLGREYVVQVTGTVAERTSKNPNLPTGDIEIIAKELKVLNKSEVPPFTIEDDTDGGDDLRMRYRYLDLRRKCVRKPAPAGLPCPGRDAAGPAQPAGPGRAGHSGGRVLPAGRGRPGSRLRLRCPGPPHPPSGADRHLHQSAARDRCSAHPAGAAPAHRCRSGAAAGGSGSLNTQATPPAGSVRTGGVVCMRFLIVQSGGLRPLWSPGAPGMPCGSAHTPPDTVRWGCGASYSSGCGSRSPPHPLRR